MRKLEETPRLLREFDTPFSCAGLEQGDGARLQVVLLSLVRHNFCTLYPGRCRHRGAYLGCKVEITTQLDDRYSWAAERWTRSGCWPRDYRSPTSGPSSTPTVLDSEQPSFRRF